MKNNVQTLIIFLAGLMLFASCETVVEMKLPEQPPKIVVNSIFTPDSLIMVHLSKSKFVLSNEQLKEIEDAEISLFENGNYIGKFSHLNKGFYILSGFYPKINAQYKLTATYQNLKSVEAIETVPQQPVINRVEISSSYYQGENFKDFIVYIEDNANEENYYMIELFGKRYDYIYDTLTYDIIDSIEIVERVHFSTQDLVFDDQGVSPQSIISDKIFNGTIYPIRLSVSANSFYENNYLGYFEITVRLKNISKAYAQYMLSYSKNGYSDPFSQPVQVFSNVKNGFGIFAAYASTYKTLKLK